MARHIKTKKADKIQIGNDVTLLVTRSRGGELCLHITAPLDLPIQHFKGASDPNDVPDMPKDTPFGVLPSQIIR